MRKILLLILCLITVSGSLNAQKKGHTKYVNLFIGTDGTGHAFPGPCRPFGMVQPGPDNQDTGWEYTSGYQYRDTSLLGFSQTRANGTGIPEFGDILLLPMPIDRDPVRRIGYDKSSEKATTGHYSVKLNSNIAVELTASERVAFHRYRYPTNGARLLIDFQHGLRFLTDSLVLASDIQFENDSTISGSVKTKNWVEKTYYFVIRFNQAFKQVKELPKNPRENAPRYLLDFQLNHRTLTTKIALSTVSIEGAHANLQAEIPHWDFQKVVKASKQAWETFLSRIHIQASKKQKEIFYTSMYRLFIQPSNIADVDGQYRGADDQVKTAKNKTYYSTLSLWDTYRAAHPLYTLLAPERVNGFINTFIDHAEAAGFLPIWTAWGKDNYCMIGNHAIPVIADAYQKGFREYDAEKALQWMVKSSTENHINSNWTLLNKFGYYPMDSLDNESVSRTLEHGIDDAAIAQMAKAMGKPELAKNYEHRSKNYKNLFDPSTNLFRGKDSKGNWRTPFDPLTATSPLNNPGDYTEANAWQYFWTPAQYDLEGTISLLGGKNVLEAKLDSFFSIKSVNANKYLGQEAMIGQYAHGNEPSHHIAYLYAYTLHPEKGRKIIKDISAQFYNNTPNGMIGNDDCGQMSAWYIFSTLGVYPVNPNNGQYTVGIPQVRNAKIYTGQGDKYIQIKNLYRGGRDSYLKMDGRTIKETYITHDQLINAKKVVFN
jgi:predicted alpha-1,2-mannosidase